MSWQKEYLKYPILSAIITVLVMFFLQIFINFFYLPFPGSISVFLGTFVGLGAIGKIKKPTIFHGELEI